MIKVFGMESCPDCRYVEAQIQGKEGFVMANIGEDVKNLKEFLRLRDENAAFEGTRKNGGVGIPCFLKEDGTVTLSPEEVGLKSRPAEGAACSIDGKGC